MYSVQLPTAGEFISICASYDGPGGGGDSGSGGGDGGCIQESSHKETDLHDYHKPLLFPPPTAINHVYMQTSF